MQDTIRINKRVINKAKESGKPDSRLEEQVKIQEIQQKILEDIISRFAQDLIVNNIGTGKNFRAENAEEIANNITADEMLDILQGYIDVYEKKVFEYENEDGKKKIISSDDKDYEKLKTTLKAVQNLESQLLSEISKTKSFDERMDKIEEKNSKNEQLSINEIRLIYELDLDHETPTKNGELDEEKFKERRSKTGKILESRDHKSDISRVSGYSQEEIGDTNEGDNLSFSRKEINYGDVILDFESSERLKIGSRGSLLFLPKKEVIGNLFITLVEAKGGLGGINFPQEEVTKDLRMDVLQSAEGLKFPKKVRWDLNLSELQFAKEVVLSDEVGDNLILSSLKSAEGLKFPRIVGRDIDLSSITTLKGLELPEEVGGVVKLSSLPDNEKEQLRLKYPKLKIE